MTYVIYVQMSSMSIELFDGNWLEPVKY